MGINSLIFTNENGKNRQKMIAFVNFFDKNQTILFSITIRIRIFNKNRRRQLRSRLKFDLKFDSKFDKKKLFKNFCNFESIKKI